MFGRKEVGEMLPAEGFFVTPHALRRFRERIDPEAADQEIYAHMMGLAKRLPDYVTYRRDDAEAVLYRSSWKGREFTVWVAPPGDHGPWPAVCTVIDDCQQLDRWLSWARDACWRATKHGRQIWTLVKFGLGPQECAKIINQRLYRVLKHWAKVLSNPDYDRTGNKLGPGRPYQGGNSTAVHMAEPVEEHDRCG